MNSSMTLRFLSRTRYQPSQSIPQRYCSAFSRLIVECRTGRRAPVFGSFAILAMCLPLLCLDAKTGRGVGELVTMSAESYTSETAKGRATRHIKKEYVLGYW